MRLFGIVIMGVSLSVVLTACSDDSQPRLATALGKEGIKNITVTDAKVTATCATGVGVEVPASELEKNFLGMVKTDRITFVANKIYKLCDEKDSEKRRADGAKAAMGEQAKALGIDIAGMDDDAAKKAICVKLTAALPLKDPDRTVDDAKNQNKWGCAPAPPVADLPTGAWQIDVPAPQGKKPVTSYLRLQNDAGDKLTVRCAGNKPDFYVQTNDPVKKGTKTVDATVGGAAKPAKWKVKPSTDGKAFFFVDTKPTFKALNGADSVTLVVPELKKPTRVTFKTKGIGEALKKLPKPCQG